MAVVPMKRALVIGHTDEAERLTLALQRGEVMEIEQAEFTDGQETASRAAGIAREEASLLDRLDDARFALELLGRSRVPPKRPFASFVTEKFHIGVGEFETIDRDLNFEHLLSECRRLEGELSEVDRLMVPLDRRAEELDHWLWLDVRLDELRGTRHTRAVMLRGIDRHLDAFESSLADRAPAAEAVRSDSTMVVITHVGQVDSVSDLAREHGLTEVPLPHGEDTPSAELELVGAEHDRLLAHAEAIRGEVEVLSRLYPDVFAFSESTRNALARVHARQRFDATTHAVFIQGWVRADRPGALSSALAPFREIDVTLVDPLPEEAPPVEIQNPKWLEPFELLTRLYGMPDYRELDPTPLFAPFFIVFFGITVGDVGYGLMLAVTCWLILKRVDIAENARKFMRLVIYGGFAAMIVGVLTGGWFAVEMASLPAPLRRLVVLDPLGQAMAFLIFATVLGVVQISWGLLVESWDRIRSGEWWSAVRDQATTLLVLLAGVGTFAGWITSMATPKIPAALAVVYAVSLKGLAIGVAAMALLGGGFYEPAVETLRARREGGSWPDLVMTSALAAVVTVWVVGAIAGAAWVGWQVLAGTVVVAVVVSRTGRKMIVGLLSGLYIVYGMTAYIGDVLSYARLMALGLATVLVGATVNLMAGMVFAGRPSWPVEADVTAAVGFVLLYLLATAGGLAVLVFGHTFNVGINLLGSFVHPMRLQFVEFFGKFYEGSGRPFKPLAYTTDTLVLDRSEP